MQRNAVRGVHHNFIVNRSSSECNLWLTKSIIGYMCKPLPCIGYICDDPLPSFHCNCLYLCLPLYLVIVGTLALSCVLCIFVVTLYLVLTVFMVTPYLVFVVTCSCGDPLPCICVDPLPCICGDPLPCSCGDPIPCSCDVTPYLVIVVTLCLVVTLFVVTIYLVYI